jgi:ribosomal protein S18 acetylase RimI-like enzyme
VAGLRDFDDLLTLNATLEARDAFSRPRLRYLLRHATVLIASCGRATAGFCIVTQRGYVHAIAVAPQCRRHGVAKTMLASIKRQFEKLRCEIRASNTASEKLFKQAGFSVVGMKPGVYADGEAALELRLL